MTNNTPAPIRRRKRKSKADKKPNLELVVNTVERQCQQLFLHWQRKGKKTTRNEIATTMTRVVVQICRAFGINSVAGIGKKQVVWWYEHLREEGRSQKTIDKYYYHFCLLWELLGRHGVKPPEPFAKGSWYKEKDEIDAIKGTNLPNPPACAI